MLISRLVQLKNVNFQGKVQTEMEEEESVAVPIRSGQIRLHRSSRRSKNHSRHEHKCHKGRKKSSDFLSGKIDELRQRNYFLNKKVKANAGDSNLYQTHEMLSPFKMDVNMAYQHLKNENNQLKIDIQNAREENEEIKLAGVKLKEENETLKEDVSLMKNLVFKLNLELERYQSGGKKIEDPIARAGKLPRNYNKNFLRPIVPLLKAYSESLLEKEETIKDLESEYKKFSAAFNDLLHENEKLYVELEKKFIGPDGSAFNEVKLLKRDLEMAKQENNLLFQQIKLEKEKLVKIHSLFKVKGKYGGKRC